MEATFAVIRGILDPPLGAAAKAGMQA